MQKQNNLPRKRQVLHFDKRHKYSKELKQMLRFQNPQEYGLSFQVLSPRSLYAFLNIFPGTTKAKY